MQNSVWSSANSLASQSPSGDDNENFTMGADQGFLDKCLPDEENYSSTF